MSFIAAIELSYVMAGANEISRKRPRGVGKQPFDSSAAANAFNKACVNFVVQFDIKVDVFCLALLTFHMQRELKLGSYIAF